MKKRGQMQMSFSMIFTIILVIAFMVFAFFAIKKFMDFQEQVQIERFFEDLQKDVDKMYKSTYGTKNLEFSLPSNVFSVCFYEYEKQVGLEFKKGPPKTREIDYLDVEEALGGEEKICLPKEDGKVNFTISMEYGQKSVVVEI